MLGVAEDGGLFGDNNGSGNMDTVLTDGNLGNGLYLSRILGPIGGNQPHPRIFNVPSLLQFQAGNPYSISIFFNINDLTAQSDGNNTLFSIGKQIYKHIFAFNIIYNNLRFGMGDINGLWGRGGLATNFNVQINTMYHIVIIYNWSNFKCYLNNIEGVITETSGGTVAELDYTGCDVIIGGLRGSSTSIDYASKSHIYNVSIFNKELNTEEIDYIYKTEGVVPASAQTSCALDLKFNENQGTNVPDKSGNGNNATLVNYGTTSNLGGGAWVDAYTNVTITT